jgi:hypothetical protein
MNVPDPIKNCTRISDLQPALHSLCAPFGAVHRLDIIPVGHSAQRSAMCFIRMGSREQEQELMQAFGWGRFGGDVVMQVDLHAH